MPNAVFCEENVNPVALLAHIDSYLPSINNGPLLPADIPFAEKPDLLTSAVKPLAVNP